MRYTKETSVLRSGGITRANVDSIDLLGAATSWDSPDPALTEFLDSLRDGVVIVGPDLRIKYFNPVYLEQYGLDENVFGVGDRLMDAMVDLAREGKLGPARGRTPEQVASERVAIWGSEESRLERRRMPNGRVLDIYRTETTRGDWISVSVDTTESDRAARELERQRIYMESLLRNTSDGITMLDRDGNFSMFNDKFLELYDVDPSKVYWGISYDGLFREFGDVKKMTPQAREAELIRRRRFAFDPEIVTVRRPLANGRTLNINKTNLPGGGCVMTIRDITDDIAREEALLEARQEAEESSRHKSEFVARMSHEMRTPLNGILGVAALLERSELDDRDRQLVSVITSSGKVLLRLIDDILDLSRMDAETFEIVEDRMTAADLVEQCLGIIRPSAEAAGLDLRFRGSPEDVPALRGDLVRIKQIVLNLLTNAVKFTETGHVELWLEHESGVEGITLTLGVTDTGVGIAQEKLGQIFDRFYQIDSTVTRRHGGAGLGLSITRKLVDMMGGTIQVESERGAGTTFRVRLTLQPCMRGRKPQLRSVGE